MPIKSYVAIPAAGRMPELVARLSSLPGCEAVPSNNGEVVILVTDTRDAEAENRLEKQLSELPELQSMGLVCGFQE